MKIVAGLFRERDGAGRALNAIASAGFGDDAVTVVGSPASAGEVVREAASELDRPADGFMDLGAVIGGQAEPGFGEEERLRAEERVAQGHTVLRVEVADEGAVDRVEAILREAGAERVLPGTIQS